MARQGTSSAGTISPLTALWHVGGEEREKGRQQIWEAIVSSDGHMDRAAERLQVSSSTLYRLLGSRRYDLLERARQSYPVQLSAYIANRRLRSGKA